MPLLQVAAQADRHNALAKLAELEGVLQQALDQRAQASEEASRAHSQLAKKSGELATAQQQLQRQHQEVTALQVCHFLRFNALVVCAETQSCRNALQFERLIDTM